MTAAIVALMAGCAPTPDPPPTTAPAPAATEEPIVVNSHALSEGFAPADTVDAYGARIGSLILRGLVRYDAKGMALPEVAESVETTDSRVYRIRLAPGWRFADGEAITAASFVDAWSRAVDPARPSARRALFAPILGVSDTAPETFGDETVDAAGGNGDGSGVTASAPDASPAASAVGPTQGGDGRSPRPQGLTILDEHTFTITLDAPHPGFEQRLGHLAFAPLPSAAFTDPEGFAAHPIGNGPYELETDWSSTQDIRLRPNRSYGGTDLPANAGLVFRPYPEPRAAMAELRSGHLHVLDALPLDELAGFRSEFGASAINQPVGRTMSLVVPLEREPWSGPEGRLRRMALSRAIDRSEIASDVFADTRSPATDLAAPVVDGHSRTLCGAACTRDADAAREALAQAGGLPEELTIAYAVDEDQAGVAQAICSDVRTTLAIGCRPSSFSTRRELIEALARGEDVGPYLAGTQMDYPSLESFLVPRFTTGAPDNDSGYSDIAADTALTRAARSGPADQRSRYLAAERIILSDLPVIPLWTVNATAASGPGVTDVRVDVFGVPLYTQLRPAQ